MKEPGAKRSKLYIQFQRLFSGYEGLPPPPPPSTGTLEKSSMAANDGTRRSRRKASKIAIIVRSGVRIREGFSGIFFFRVDTFFFKSKDFQIMLLTNFHWKYRIGKQVRSTKGVLVSMSKPQFRSIKAIV